VVGVGGARLVRRSVCHDRSMEIADNSTCEDVIHEFNIAVSDILWYMDLFCTVSSLDWSDDSYGVWIIPGL
jgi:hypothetical protein